MREIRPATQSLAKAMEQVTGSAAYLCDHGLSDPPGQEREDCPCCMLWDKVCDLKALVQEFVGEFDRQLEQGPSPKR